ncbi:MAG: SH3 domain-containing protein, partial [Lysinibacillus sp.]
VCKISTSRRNRRVMISEKVEGNLAVKKLLLLIIAAIALVGCSEKETTKESEEAAQVQQDETVLPMKDIAPLDDIQVVSYERYTGDLTEDEMKVALATYPQLHELIFTLGYIAKHAKPDFDEDDRASLIWYAKSMQKLHTYMSNMTFEELSQLEQDQLNEIFEPWLSKIKDTTDAIINVDEAYELSKHPQALNQLLGYGQDVMLIARLMSMDLQVKLQLLYGHTAVSAVSKPGYKQLIALDDIVQKIQISYEEQFEQKVEPYSAKSVQIYYEYIDSIGDPPAGYLFDYTGQDPYGEYITDFELENNPVLIEVSSKEYVKFIEQGTKIRREPSIDGEIVYTGQKNETARYSGVTYETPDDGRVWYQIVTNTGQAGYVSSKVATFTDNGNASNSNAQITITGIDVNVRIEPDINSDVVAKVYKGDELYWTGKSYPTEDGRLWYEVTVGQQLGYVSSKFVKVPQ